MYNKQTQTKKIIYICLDFETKKSILISIKKSIKIVHQLKKYCKGEVE